jgi:hypothetical protein
MAVEAARLSRNPARAGDIKQRRHTGSNTRNSADWRSELEKRSQRLGLVTVALCAMLSGCAQQIKSDVPAQKTAAGDPQCCRDQATAERMPVLPVDFEGAMAARDTAGDGLCRFKVAATDSPLRRDAFGRAPIVGHVVPGEKLTFVDFIDRRLRVLGHVVFDGGHWRKVRGQRGDLGWLPAAEVRESRGSCEPESTAMNGERRASEQARR